METYDNENLNKYSVKYIKIKNVADIITIKNNKR